MATSTEIVVMLHGLGGSRPLLYPLQRRLIKEGFEPEPWGYASFADDIEAHALRLIERLSALDAAPETSVIHCVGHSMGAIIIRAALAKTRPTKLGRVVFLAPPHGGSRVATSLAPHLGKLVRSVGQLTTAPDSYVNSLPALEGVEFGIIAASHDHLVHVESTFLAGQRDHRVLRSLHTVVLHPDVGGLVASFLKWGHF